MTFNRFLISGMLALFAAIVHAPAIAHEGEDHGADPAPVAQALLPRVEANSDLFELVGVLETGRLLIYLDRQASNAPVDKASVEVEGAGLNAVAAQTAAGTYAIALQHPLPAGRHVLSFTVQDGDSADLLAATLEVAPSVAPAPAQTAVAKAASDWRAWLAGAAAASALAFNVIALRRRSAQHQAQPRANP